MTYKNVYDDGTIKIDRSEHGWHLQTRPSVTTLLVKDKKITIIHEQKNSTGRWVWNCPGGMIEEGESFEEAAARECNEELGIIPQKLEKFATIQTEFPDTHIDFYLGSDLKQGQKEDWGDEEVIDKVEEHGWDKIYQMALDCKFNAPQLVTAILQLSKNTELLKSHDLI